MSKHHDEIIETEIEQTSKNVKYAIYFFCISTILQLLTMALYSFNNYVDRKEQAQQAELNRNEQAKQSQLNREFEIEKMTYASQDNKYKEIQYPIIAVRANLEDIYYICSKPLNSEGLKKLEIEKYELQKNRISLIQALGGIQIMFNQDVHGMFADFTANVEKVINSARTVNCPAYLPDPAFWYMKYRNLNNLMLDEVNKTETNINKTLKKE